MKLFKATIDSGNYHNSKIIYVAAEDYCSAEKKLLSDDNDYWMYNHEKRIVDIERIDEPLLA